MITEKTLNETVRLLSLFQNSGNLSEQLAILNLVGLPPRLGKNKSRKKIQEANRKYQRKLAKAKQSVEKLRLAKKFLNPLRRKFNYSDLAKDCLSIEQL